jgi:hypothetical protein
MERKDVGSGVTPPEPTTPTPDACLSTVHRSAASPSVDHRPITYDELTSKANLQTIV